LKHLINIGIIGDYDPQKASHPPTNESLRHAAKRLSAGINISWIPTLSLLTEKGQKSLADFDGIWASAGSPYQSLEGAIAGIRLAREMDKPFIGT
jgi:CTP synthase (UTP-ammonia lyase)